MMIIRNSDLVEGSVFETTVGDNEYSISIEGAFRSTMPYHFGFLKIRKNDNFILSLVFAKDGKAGILFEEMNEIIAKYGFHISISPVQDEEVDDVEDTFEVDNMYTLEDEGEL